jgi:hypothetical protein
VTKLIVLVDLGRERLADCRITKIVSWGPAWNQPW